MEVLVVYLYVIIFLQHKYSKFLHILQLTPFACYFVIMLHTSISCVISQGNGARCGRQAVCSGTIDFTMSDLKSPWRS